RDGRGGARKNSGPEKGSGEKTKICVSVHEQNWNTALKRWRRWRRQRKPSWLVDGLISYYLKTGGSILETEAAMRICHPEYTEPPDTPPPAPELPLSPPPAPPGRKIRLQE